jgi:hypothetical protein
MTTSEPVTRKCAGCGHRFRPAGGELYCCGRCAVPDAMASIYSALERFAGQQARAATGEEATRRGRR